MTLSSNKALLFMALALCWLPFARRPWFFDDSSVVLTAEATARHPLHPYNYRMDFSVPDQAVWATGGLPAYTHPPLSAWALGPWTRWHKEWPLHAVMFLLALAAVWAVSKIGESFVENPLYAAALVAFSPAFFLTSLTVYPHLFYFTFAMFALYFTLRLATGGAWANAIGLGISLLLAALSLHSWPLLLGVCALLAFYLEPGAGSGRWVRFSVAGWVFILFYGAWCAWETHLYGMPHIVATWRVRSSQGGHFPWVTRILPLVFIAGAAPFTAVGWPMLAKLQRRLVWILAALGAVMAGLFISPQGGFSPVQGLLLGVFFTTGLAFVASLVLMWRSASRSERFLSAWFLVEYLFVQKYLFYSSAHHLLPLLPPAAFLAMRMVERLEWRPAAARATVAAMAIFTLALAQADMGEAKAGPAIAASAAAGHRGNYYWGNCFSGFSYYLDRAGWKAFDVRRTPQPGDRVLIPRNLNTQGPAHLLRQWPHRDVTTYQIRQKNPLRTLSLWDSAGWYSASWGALPFSLSRPLGGG